MTRPEDIEMAVALGVDAVGFIFHPASPRYVAPERARALCVEVPAFVSRVAVVVDPTAEGLRALLEQVPVDCVQFHGDEPPELCARAGRPWLKSARVRVRGDVDTVFARYAGAAAVLLDTWSAAAHGGTGRRFDWSLIPEPGARSRPLVLSGGLRPDNVATAVAEVAPHALDVNSGVESAPGMKDRSKLETLMREVARVTAC